MTPDAPPRWLQRTLLLVLDARDRETISGDLLEEYREAQSPRLGSLRANYWYLRQVISLASVQVLGGPPLKHFVVLMSFFIMAAGTWLGVMEHILRHPGYAGRTVIALCIAIQGLVTLLFLLLDGRSVFRGVVTTGALAAVLLGASAVFRIVRAQHFEGFVFLIGLALIVQGSLTLATLLGGSYRVRPN